MNRRLEDRRSLLGVILLSLVTFGIYQFFFVHNVARDVNDMCYEDRKHTNGLLMYIVLSFVTFGIYQFFWYGGIIERVNNFTYKYGVRPRTSFGGFVLWMLLGSFIFIGPFIALHQFIQTVNDGAFTANKKAMDM